MIDLMQRQWLATGVLQPSNRESEVQAYATVRMPSQNESQIITQQIEASLPERAKVRHTRVGCSFLCTAKLFMLRCAKLEDRAGLALQAQVKFCRHDAAHDNHERLDLSEPGMERLAYSWIVRQCKSCEQA